jgi:hypothetical protein
MKSPDGKSGLSLTRNLLFGLLAAAAPIQSRTPQILIGARRRFDSPVGAESCASSSHSWRTSELFCEAVCIGQTLNLPVFCRMAVRRATRTEKSGTRDSLVSQPHPLAQSP